QQTLFHKILHPFLFKVGCLSLIWSAAARYSAMPLSFPIDFIISQSGVAEYLAAALQIKTPTKVNLTRLLFLFVSLRRHFLLRRGSSRSRHRFQRPVIRIRRDRGR